MQIERNIKMFDDFPEGPIFRKVIVHDGFRVAFAMGKAVDERALESQFFHAASQFLCGSLGILHGESCIGSEAVRALGYLPGNKIIGATRQFGSLFGICHGLKDRGVQ